MPSRNTIREFAPDNFYHVYNRGVEKRLIFLDTQDYQVFISLLKRYLAKGQAARRPDRHVVAGIADEVSLLAYCLMPNHFHLLLYQQSDSGITKLMRRLVTGYVMYFNHRYGRVGTLFQSKYKASRINSDAYLHHISRYIHLNPDEYLEWPASSLPYYLGRKTVPNWLNVEPVLRLFDHDSAQYRQFLTDYKNTRDEMAELKWQLANDPED